jgi:chromosome segregation ATPase
LQFAIALDLVYLLSNLEGGPFMTRNQAMNRTFAKDWSEVIGKVQEVLAQTEAEAADRARILKTSGMGVTPVLPQAEEKVTAWKQGLEHYEERMQGFQACLQQAEKSLDEAELSLSQVEAGLKEWGQAAEAIRKKWQESSGGEVVR